MSSDQPKPPAPHQLLTDVHYIRLQLGEASADGKLVVRGEFAKCGIATENKRVYSQKLWETQFKHLGKAMGERRVFGEVDHPESGRTSLQRVSHIVTGLKVKDGLIIGEAEVLPTDSGRNLSALLKAGCKIGVSSRGYGSVKSNDKGEDVVQEDYKLVTFDFVADPADSDAFPEMVENKNTNQRLVFEGVAFEAAPKPTQEGLETPMPSDVEKKEAELAQEFTKKASEAPAVSMDPAALREELSRTLISEIAKMKTEVREQVRAEMLTDPSVAGAKTALESLKGILRPFLLPEDTEVVVRGKDQELTKLRKDIAERDLKIKDLEVDQAKLVEISKEIGYRFFLAQTLASNPDRDLITTLIGDVKEYASADLLKAKLTSIQEDLAKKAAELKAIEDKRAEEQKAADEKQAALLTSVRAEEAEKARVIEAAMAVEKGKTLKMEEALRQSVLANKHMALQLYLEKRLVMHPQASSLRTLSEGREFSTTDEIDAFVEAKRVRAPDADEVESTRARVRKLSNGGSERDPSPTPSKPIVEEVAAPPSNQGDFNGTGISLSDLKRLSGVSSSQR